MATRRVKPRTKDYSKCRRVITVVWSGQRYVSDYATAKEARAAYERAVASRVYMQVHIEEC